LQEYYTVSEVAEMKNVNAETVRRWLRTGKLKGQRLGGTKSGWRIHRHDLTPAEDAEEPQQRVVDLIKHMLEDRALFNQFARDVFYQLKRTTRYLLPEETTEMFLARTKAKDPDLTAELWRHRVAEQKELLEETYRQLEKNYENCKKHWKIKTSGR
jgi:excisionase family DNA binding protein